ncbi:MAG: ribose-phosphate diphosphokinase [Candidatus Aenigmarchaeota archaeon]|nr:ribose-phosphate diphosphokinase [Candidatus Aenigmarchaeota archaeon]
MILVGPKDEFVEELKNRLNIELIEIEKKVFPDRELRPRILDIDKIKYQEVLFVNRPDRPLDMNKYLMESILAIKILKSAGAKKINFICPYLPYARQDKIFRPGEPLSAKWVVDMIKDAGAEKIITVSCHFHPEEGVVDNYGIDMYNVSGFKAISAYLRNMNLENPAIIGPDEKAGTWAKEIADIVGAEYDSLKKERNRDTGEIKTIDKLNIETSGRDVVIIDDMAAGGGTLVNALDILGQKPKRKIAIVVHPLLLGNCLKKVREKSDLFLSTDTIPSEISKISVVGEIARIISCNI